MALTDFLRAPSKKSLLAMLKKADKLTPRLLDKLFEGVLFKSELKGFSSGGAVDHGELSGLTDDDHAQYLRKDGTRALTANWDAGSYEIRAQTLESDVATGTAPLTIASTTLVTNLNADLLDSQTGSYYLDSDNFTGTEWTDLTDAGATTLHKHDHGGQDGLADDDHTQYLPTNASRSITGTLTFSGVGDIAASVNSSVCLSSYIDVKARNSVYDFHGAWESLATGQPLDSVPTDLPVVVGTSKVVIVINAGTDVTGSITVTGTTVDRNTGAETGADTDTITVDALTTDASDTDADGNVRHSFTGAYITSKWFKGAVTLSTADLTLTDVDVYQVAFEQFNDSSSVTLNSLDLTAYATNAAAWMYAYLYTLVVTGDKCTITRLSSLDLPAAEVSTNKSYRLRRGNLATTISGTSDGIWVEMFPGPLASVYWEDINLKVWATIKTDVYGEAS